MEYPSLNTPPAGSIRFNTDSAKMEIYNGDKWWEIDGTSPEVQTGGTRGVWMGGQSPSNQDRIDYANLDSTGNAIDFGNLTTARGSNGDGGMASRTRGFMANGQSPIAGQIGYITFSSTGNETDFGDMASNITNGASTASDETRGLIFGGYASPATLNVIQYITMASSGNGIDFGDLDHGGSSSACGSPTRACEWNSGNEIEYVTISTLGNTAQFGSSLSNGGHKACSSNAVRGLCSGTEVGPTAVNNIEYITFTTLGTTSDFGDLSTVRCEGSSASSPTRSVNGGGTSATDVMDYVKIMSTGNAIDFGNLTIGRGHADASSNGHGGLG